MPKLRKDQQQHVYTLEGELRDKDQELADLRAKNRILEKRLIDMTEQQDAMTARLVGPFTEQYKMRHQMEQDTNREEVIHRFYLGPVHKHCVNVAFHDMMKWDHADRQSWIRRTRLQLMRAWAQSARQLFDKEFIHARYP